jgi:hypothetical protein
MGPDEAHKERVAAYVLGWSERHDAAFEEKSHLQNSWIDHRSNSSTTE